MRAVRVVEALNELLDPAPGRARKSQQGLCEFEKRPVSSKSGDYRLEPGVVSGTKQGATAPINPTPGSPRSGTALQFGCSLPGVLDYGLDLGAQGPVQFSACFVGREPGLATLELAEIAHGKTSTDCGGPQGCPFPGRSKGLPNLKASRQEEELTYFILGRHGILDRRSGRSSRLGDAPQAVEGLQDRVLPVRGDSGQPAPTRDERPSRPSEILAEVPEDRKVEGVAPKLVEQSSGGLGEGRQGCFYRLLLDVRWKLRCS